MKKEIKDIKFGIGLGVLKFGMSREQVKTILGEPNEKELHYDEDINVDASELWHYDDLDVSISFDQEEDWKLVTLAVTSNSYQLNGKSLIGMNKKALLSELKNSQIDDLDIEDLSSEESPNHVLLSSFSLGVNFWLDDGILEEIQWGPDFIDDDTIKWPKLD